MRCDGVPYLDAEFQAQRSLLCTMCYHNLI